MSSVNKFEYTREFVIFDLFDIPMYHGWVIDPQNTSLQEIINDNGLSYNQLIEKMLQQKQSNNEKHVHESLLIEQFFDENQSQLTHYGILQLNETMQENELAVFFRNNHFSTIWKHNVKKFQKKKKKTNFFLFRDEHFCLFLILVISITQRSFSKH